VTFDAVSEKSVTAGQIGGLAGHPEAPADHVSARQLRRLELRLRSRQAIPIVATAVSSAEIVFLTADIADTLILNQLGGS